MALTVWAALTAASASPLRVVDPSGVTVDWTAGELRARGLGVADRRAPGPATARAAARRRAVADAQRQLVAAARALPWADGGALGDHLDARALAAAALGAKIADAEPLVDGSWRVELALPLEALRQAVTGPRPVVLDGPGVGAAASAVASAADDADALPLLIVRAPAAAKPALGIAVQDRGTSRRGATLWVRGSTEGAGLPAQLLERAPVVEASLVGAGSGLRVARLPVTGRIRVTDATLFLIVLGQ
ncbi:MAG: hypothetical protein IPI49_02170 [Myxococcales bacterium]|nr:hypothetical protein [Myxococcales bacterium]